MDKIHDGWFSESSEDCGDSMALSLKVEEILHHCRSNFQEILIFKSATYGRVLVLDGMIQCTERDEWAYHEMIVNLPVNCHPNPEKVLVIGGGDGGVVRELDKHPKVKQVVLCELDKEVISLSKQYLPSVAVGFDSPKLSVNIEDGCVFLKEHQGIFDIIITDSTDPIGPSTSLFEKPYYELVKSALKPGGIVCSQAESVWHYESLIKKMQSFCHELFPVVDYAFTSIPTYMTGQIGFLLCSRDPTTDFKEPLNVLTDEDVDKIGLHYYNSHIHRASFHLPHFAHKALRQW